MAGSTPRNAPMLGPLMALAVVCAGCPSANTPGNQVPPRYPPYAPRPVPTVQQPRTPFVPRLPARPPVKVAGQPQPRVVPRPPVRTPGNPFGPPAFQPSTSTRTNGRINPVPSILPKLPKTPAAAVQARVPLPKGTKPEPNPGPGALFGIGAGLTGTVDRQGNVSVPTYGLGKRDLALAFYTKYLRKVHQEMGGEQAGAKAKEHREALAKALRKGKAEEPQAFQAFQDLFDAQWGGKLASASGVDLLIVNKPAPLGESDRFVILLVSSDLTQLFGGATSATANADLQANTARLVDPMSAQDFYNQYLRTAHQAYKSAWSFTNMDETNDFAEALATGRRADEIGYEALRQQLKQVSSGADVLGGFRDHWNYYLRLATGHGGDTPIETKNGQRTVKGKTESEWKSAAEDSMSKVSEALDKAL